MKLSLNSFSTEDTCRIGNALASTICEVSSQPQLVVCLNGSLGSGKTVFVRGCCEGLGVDSTQISSPTFALQNVYIGQIKAKPVPVNHFDFYRLSDEDELFQIGFEETIGQRGIHLVEWSEKFPQVLPPDRLQITIHPRGSDSRLFSFQVCGHFPIKILEDMKGLLPTYRADK